MKALDFPLLANENVNPEVISFLREIDLDVESIAEQGNFGLSDDEVLKQATNSGRVVLTHDSDFGDWRYWVQNLLELFTCVQVTFEQASQ